MLNQAHVETVDAMASVSISYVYVCVCRGHVQSQIVCSPPEFKCSIYRRWVMVHDIVSLFTVCYVTYVNFMLLLHCLSAECAGSGPTSRWCGRV